jgi:hypothetical protein
MAWNVQKDSAGKPPTGTTGKPHPLFPFVIFVVDAKMDFRQDF